MQSMAFNPIKSSFVFKKFWSFGEKDRQDFSQIQFDESVASNSLIFQTYQLLIEKQNVC